jgi:arylamine N-acetyltransferase
VIAESESLAEVFAKANREESLTDVDMVRLNSWWMSVLRHAENMHYQWEQSHLSEELLVSATNRIARGLLANKHASRIWTGNRADFNEPFVNWLDGKMDVKR